jgi:hypothetical protein
MAAATASVSGYLLSGDWETFNAKQPNLSLLPGTYVNGDMCTYASSGTLLNCNTAVPTVGTWGALNYPSWSSGTPFVKMTAAGVFTLDTNTYAPSSGIALTALATQAADTIDMNATGGSAVPTAIAMPTCTTGADLYNTSTHSWSCVSSGGTLTNPITFAASGGAAPGATFNGSAAVTVSYNTLGADAAGAATAAQSAAETYANSVNTTGTAAGLSGISFSSLTDSSSVTWAIASAQVANANLTLAHGTSTRSLNLTGLVNGGSYVVILKQDSTGGAAATLGTGCTWYEGGSAGFTNITTLALTTTASAINVLAFTYDGTNCYSNLR